MKTDCGMTDEEIRMKSPGYDILQERHYVNALEYICFQIHLYNTSRIHLLWELKQKRDDKSQNN